MKKDTTKKRLTVIEIEAYLRKEIPPGISRQSVYEHIRKAGLKPDAKSRFDLMAFLDAYMESKAKDNKTGNIPPGTGEGQDPKRYKTLLECKLLKIRIGQAEDELISLADHIDEMRTFANWTRDVLAQWVSEIKVITGDAKVCAEAERLRDVALARMLERIQKSEKEGAKK